MKPENLARQGIDRKLREAGWSIQEHKTMNVRASRGVAVCEFVLRKGRVDYLLFVDGRAVGVLEAKKSASTLSGVEPQAKNYAADLPEEIDAALHPLPFIYLATDIQTRFCNLLDPKPTTRDIFQFHRPETLAYWLAAMTLDAWVMALEYTGGFYTAADNTRPSTLRSRLSCLPPLEQGSLRLNQFEAVQNLEASLKGNRSRALIQMATGSGKTIMAITAVYRLIKFSGLRRVLFLVDRGNLGIQAETAFQGFRAEDGNRLFTDDYNVQRLQSSNISDSSLVVISTIQRLYSILTGGDLDEVDDEQSAFEKNASEEERILHYNAKIPPEFFDLIIIDECHRSIYTSWRPVLEYFDAFLVGLTATPTKQTLGFFNQNLVMEYGHEAAVADGVNVDFEVYRIRTQVTEGGGEIKNEYMVEFRDRLTRAKRWEQPDEDIRYSGADLDRDVVNPDQIRLIARTFKEKLFTELFPGRRKVPKTLIFAKDDSHAEDVVAGFRQVFGEGDDFCVKITYKTLAGKPVDLIKSFRNAYQPRIAVTVDMIATGTDIRPLEVVIFLRSVRSLVLFEQMKGRGVRVIDSEDLRLITPDAEAKTHFIIVDCVGVTEALRTDTQPLERKRSLSLRDILDRIAAGALEDDLLSSLAVRLARLDRRCDPKRKAKLTDFNCDLRSLSQHLITALDPDEHRAKAKEGLNHGQELTDDQIQAARNVLCAHAVQPLVDSSELCDYLVQLQETREQVIDEINADVLLEADYSEEAKQKARSLIGDFRTFIEKNRAEIDALEYFFSHSYERRLRLEDIKELHAAIVEPPRSWTPEKLWKAYERVAANQVRDVSGKRALTDLVSLIRFTLEQESNLRPYGDHVEERFENWLAQQEQADRFFSDDQHRWLTMIKDHVAKSLSFEMGDFELSPFKQAGGLGRARTVFVESLSEIIKELNEVLAA